jgi:cytochrome c553
MKKLAVTMIAGLLTAGAFAADIEAGKAKSATCIACHGPKGVSAVPLYPNLAGQKAAYLESAMKAYKSQERKGGNAAIMWGLAAPLSDDDIANLAAYYASLDPSGK